MNRTKTEAFSRLVWLSLVLVTAALLCRSGAAPAVQGERDNVISQVVENWLAVGQRQYERRMYDQSRDSLQQAKQYNDYLSPAQLQQIDELTQKISQAQSQTSRLLDNVNTANSLIEQGEFLKARSYLVEAAESELLNDDQAERARSMLKRVETKIAEQKRLMAKLYKQSRTDYRKGDIEKARQGFAVVASSGLYVPTAGKSAEKYLAEIEQRPVKQEEPPKNKPKVRAWSLFAKADGKKTPDNGSKAATTPQPPSPSDQQPPANALLLESPPQEFGDIPSDSAAGKESLKESYVTAVVRDAQTRVNLHVGQAQFSLAMAVVDNADKTLQMYRQDIDQRLYSRCGRQLQELSRMIEQQQRSWELRWDTKDSGL